MAELKYSNVRVEVLDSITKLTDTHRGQVVIAASHGAEYAAYLAAKGGVRAVILNDAGVGMDDAGISGLPYLEALGIAAATVDYRSARIGDGGDMLARGTISHINAAARKLGCAPRQSCGACADLLRAASTVSSSPPPQTENRILLRENVGEPPVWGIDSASLILPEDTDHILICGSHGEALGGKPETALRYDAVAAVFNDAGTSRLPALDGRNIPAATVAADSARIGDARSIYETGVISRVNETAAAQGVKPGLDTRAFVDSVIAVRK
jgi:hypothetical protein